MALVACQGEEEPAKPPAFATNLAEARVVEEVEGDGRQYVRVVEDTFDFWASLPATPQVQVGDALWLGHGPEQKALRSEATGRVFDAIIVIDDVAVATDAELAAFTVLAPPSGGRSIEAVYAERAALAGQPVKVRGRVVKASPNIFGTNWYHLRDGTGAEGTNDLTVTSNDVVQEGQIVVAEGPLTVDKDLGFGYQYDAIVEGAKVVAEP
jgi:hypothetical protein